MFDVASQFVVLRRRGRDGSLRLRAHRGLRPGRRRRVRLHDRRPRYNAGHRLRCGRALEANEITHGRTLDGTRQLDVQQHQRQHDDRDRMDDERKPVRCEPATPVIPTLADVVALHAAPN
jgi:hypothetical protein